ncbi:MAG TPA: S1 family peptidase [Xanthobacteraceae bacterium]|jgi:secreted trypsin-like serine protease|nr:S1 family peptidase [Xanthobacteraceae bacterium]
MTNVRFIPRYLPFGLVTALAIAAMNGAAVISSVAMVGGAPPAAGNVRSSVVTILSSYGTFCTATAITRDLLLTAGHCVEPDGHYKLADTVPGQVPALKDVVRTARHPQFDIKRLFGHLATADVALLKLAEPAPARVTPARIGGEDELIAIGDVLTVAGIGVTVRGADQLDGLAHAATLTVTGHPSSLEIRLFDPATKGVSAGLGACTGDSGAPAFRDENGSLVVIGIVSWSTGPNLTGGCGGLTGLTPLQRYRSWIVDTAKVFGSPLAP